MPTQANPAALRQAASQFSAAAEALQTKVVELDTAVSSLVPNGWRGRGAQAFLHTWEHVRQDAQQATEALLQTAAALQSLAAKLESAASHKWWKIALGTGLVLASGALLFVDVVQGGVNVATDAATAGTAQEAGAVLASAAADAAVADTAADTAAASEFDYIGTLAQKVATYLARSLPTMGKMALINVGQTAGLQLLGTGNVNAKGLFDSAAMGFTPLPGLGKAAEEAVQLTEEGAAVESTAQNAADAVPIEAGTAKGTVEASLSSNEIDYAVSNQSRLQHAFKHAQDLGFGNWNKATAAQWKSYISDILGSHTKSFSNTLGADNVMGYYKMVDGNPIAVYIYDGGPNKGLVASVVRLSGAQLSKFGLK